MTYPCIEARYGSECPWCDMTIDEGDPIYKIDGEWVCDSCHEETLAADDAEECETSTD